MLSEQAKAAAEDIQKLVHASGPIYDPPTVEALTATILKHLQEQPCKQCGCTHDTAYELGRQDERVHSKAHY